jgi:hypothetical protein
MWELDGNRFTDEQLQLAADNANLSFDELINKLREKGLTEVKVDRIGDDIKEEEGSFFEEINPINLAKKFGRGVLQVGSSLSQLPAFINRGKFVARMERLPDDNPLKEYYNNLEPEKQDEFIQKYEAAMSIGAPGAQSITRFGQEGLDLSENLQGKIDKLNESLPQYEKSLSEAYIAAAKGDITAVPEAASRTLSEFVGAIPSVLQAMVPGVGIPSVIGGSAAQSSTEAIKEGKKVDLNNLIYSSTVGMAEGALETVTRGIGKSVFKNLKGQGVEVVERRLRDIFLRIGKDYGKEGLSEGTSAAISKAARAVYIGDANTFDEVFNSVFDDYEILDNILIGGAVGGKLRAGGEIGVGVKRKSVRKTLDNTNVNDVNSAFQNDNINQDVIDIARNENSGMVLESELQSKVNNGEITVEERDRIKKNFNDTQSAVTLADNLNIGKDLIQETVTLLKERNALAGKIELAGANKAIVDAEINRLKEVDARLAKISSDNQLNLTTEKVTDIVSGLDKINIEIAENQDAADKIAKDKNLEKKASSQQGFILQDLESGEQTIVINKEIAAEDAAVNVAAHELLHGVLFNTVGKNPEAAEVLSEALKVEINKIDTDILKDSDFKTRLDAYKNDPTAIQAEETLTLFADAVANGEIKYNETVFTKIGDIVRRILQQAGLSDIKFNTSRDVFNFIKDYNNSIVKGQLTQAQAKLTQEAATGALISDAQADQTTQIRESKSALDAINNIIPSNIKTKEQFQNDPKVFGDAFAATEPNGVISNYVKSRSTSVEQANATIRNIQSRLMNFDPAFNKTFGEFVFANTNFAKLDANKELAIESARRAVETRIDQSTKQIADTQTETPTTQTRVSRKLNVLKLDKVNEADLVKAVKVKEGDTFKEVINNNTGEIGSKIFNIPANKITDGTKNLTYAKKITDGIPENSEAGNIQEFFRVGQNADKFIKLLPEENVSETDADINELGENIDVDRNVSGLSIGMKGKVLNYFYNKTNRRSKGLTSQPTIWELKPEFRNPTVETINKLKDDLGITPPGELNNYNRDIGQLLKGVAKTYAQQASLSSAQRVLEGQTKTAKDPVAVKKQTANITAAQKTRVVYSKRIKNAFNVFMKDQSFKRNPTEFAAENKNWKGILKAIDQVALDPKSENDVKEFKTFTKKLTGLLPESFFTVGTFANAGVSAPKRGFYFTSISDVNATIEGSKFAKPDTDIEAAVTRESYTNIENKLSKKEFQDRQKASIKGLKKIFNVFEKLIKQDPKNARFIAAMLSSTSQGMGHFVRTSAPITFYSKNLVDGKVEEHTLPASLVAKYLFTSALDGKVNENFANIQKNYQQGLLSKADDKKLKGFKPDGKPFNYTSTTPEGWQITDNVWARYFNVNVAGIDPSNIILSNGNNIVQEFGIDAKGFATNQNIETSKSKAFVKNQTKYSKSTNNDGLVNDLNNYDKALRNAKDINAPKKGISVFDFDDTLATTKSKIIVNMPNGSVKKITPAEFAKQHGKLQDQGAEFDFSEFNEVIDGKPGPLAAKLKKAIDKFGNKDVFVLTARPQASAQAIYDFLKGIGLEVPLENITGLEDGSPQAKANWVIGKAANGYNDFYFTDDVYKNVKAVQDALEVLDVKSKSRLAYESRIQKLDRDFNDIIEAKTGIGADKVYSKAKAKAVGSSKGRFTFFIPPSAEDFVGLLYNTLAKGKLGDNQMAWYKKNLLDPYATAMGNISRERTSLMNDYKALKNQLEVVPKNLQKKIPGEPYTNEQAVRVYIWNKQGMPIPGLSKADLKLLTDHVESKPVYKAFGDQLIAINKDDGYSAPKSSWLAGTVTTDLMDNLGTTKRAKHLAEWQRNVDVIFSEKNLNKMEAAFGLAHRQALEGILERMRTGRNRSFQGDSLTGKVTDWLTNSIGTIMFFNTRSALLQTISSVNFINFRDNNIFAAGKAFANQPQYWKDFMTLMNSEFLVDRRRGLQINVNEADIANMAREGGPRGVISKLLEFGFLPTQIADSFAIASGGASFYRNRINRLKKQGLDQKAAELQAMKDFREIAEESQQSSRPDRISAQQAGPLGRIILAFGNTPMQYARLIKKAASDLKNRRGDWKTNTSKIIYYAAVQNLIFNALQQAIFAISFGDVEEEDEQEKYQSIANGMADSLLRGVGIAGAFVSVGKNAIIRIMNESEKPNPKYEKIGYELTRISPPISSKLSKINQAARSLQWEKEEMKEKGFSIDNPALLAGANVISATTNLPLDRLVKKTNNVVNATSDDLETWERLALLGGWQDWEIGIDDNKNKKKKKKKASTTGKRERIF